MRELVFVSALLFCTAAQATDWVKLGSSPSGVTIAFDRETTRLAYDHVTIFDRVVYPSAQQTADPGAPGRPIAFVEVRGQHDIDCTARTVINTELKYLDAGGAVVRTVKSDGPAVPVVPGSSNAVLAKMYCPNW